jgi:hypothetical protein
MADSLLQLDDYDQALNVNSVIIMFNSKVIAQSYEVAKEQPELKELETRVKAKV